MKTPPVPLWLLLLASLTAAWPGGASAQPAATGPLLDDLLPNKAPATQIRALKAIETSHDRSAIPTLIELLRFELDIPVELPVGVLERLSGQRFGRDWARWVDAFYPDAEAYTPRPSP